MEQTTYRFAPHPASGVLLGLRAPQLAGLALAAALALGALHLRGLAGLAPAIWRLGGGVLLLPLHGQTLERWAPVVLRFLLARIGGGARFRSQRAQLGHVVLLPSGRLDPLRPVEPWAMPAELSDIELLEG